MDNEKEATSTIRRVRISLNALKNINEITGYISILKKQPLNAIKVGDAIFEMIDRIVENPFAYRECEELATKSKMYRRAVCFSWLIIYKITSNEIIILGITHGSRRPTQIKKLRNIK